VLVEIFLMNGRPQWTAIRCKCFCSEDKWRITGVVYMTKWQNQLLRYAAPGYHHRANEKTVYGLVMSPPKEALALQLKNFQNRK